MSIIRVKKEEKYSVISNDVLHNKNLTWEARGIMAYLLSKPDGWECRNYDLVNQGPAGKTVVQRVLKELQDAGYIHRYQKSDGHKIDWITEIYESPELNTTSRNTGNPPAEEPTVGKPAGRKQGHIVSTDSNKYGSLENNDFIPQTSKNPQNNGTPSLTQNEKDDLNILAVHIAKATSTPTNADEHARDRLKATTLLGYKIAQACTLIISIIEKGDPKTMVDLVKVAISLYQNNVTRDQLEKFIVWWYANTWQGQKGQAPKPPTQIASHWGQFEASQAKPANGSGPTLTDEQKARLEELTAQDAQK